MAIIQSGAAFPARCSGALRGGFSINWDGMEAQIAAMLSNMGPALSRFVRHGQPIRASFSLLTPPGTDYFRRPPVPPCSVKDVRPRTSAGTTEISAGKKLVADVSFRNAARLLRLPARAAQSRT